MRGGKEINFLLSMLERMNKDIINRVVDFHVECFKDSFLTNLDRSILTCMYENYVSSDLGCAYVYVENGEVAGVVAGTINPSVYYNQLLRKRGVQILWLTIKRVFKDPKILVSIARRNFGGFFRPDKSKNAYQRASLDVIGVKQEYRGTGIAQKLAEAFFNELKMRGVCELNLGVLATNTRSKRFYEKIGLRHIRTIKHPSGDELHIYSIKFGS